MSSLKSYEYLRIAKPRFAEMVEFYFIQLFKQIRRRLKVKPTMRMPYRIIAKETIHRHIFNSWLVALQECKTWVGLEIDLRPSNKIKVVKFLNREVLDYHISKGLNNNEVIRSCFKKKVGRCTLNMIVTIESPLVFEYNSKNCVLTAHCSYEVLNWCNNVVSL